MSLKYSAELNNREYPDWSVSTKAQYPSFVCEEKRDERIVF